MFVTPETEFNKINNAFDTQFALIHALQLLIAVIEDFIKP